MERLSPVSEPRRGGTYPASWARKVTPPVLGSRATHLVSAMGGYEGRALRAGDRVTLGQSAAGATSLHGLETPVVALPEDRATLRVLAGPQDDEFTPDALDLLQSAPYVVGANSDRMGFRMDGPRLTHAGGDIISDATPLGVLQVPPSGLPILLMADRQTTGGYPKIATVISADMSTAGQLGPGDKVSFAACTHREAMSALIAQERAL